jgi:hypothetical protein
LVPLFFGDSISLGITTLVVIIERCATKLSLLCVQ